jgi:diguanylate cyclase (GGDEF)-like protein/PAS domain S-box-containing protein
MPTPPTDPALPLVLAPDPDVATALRRRLEAAGLPAEVLRVVVVQGGVEGDGSADETLGHAVRAAMDGLALQDRLAAVARELRLLEAAVDQARDGMVVTEGPIGEQGPRIRWANTAFCHLVGVAREDLLDRAVGTVGFLARHRERLVRGLSQEASWDASFTEGEGASARHLELHLGRVEAGGPAPHHVGILRDVTRKKRVEARLVHLAHHDALTGLPNRKLLQDRLEQALARARRYDDAVGVIFVDLDGFKAINDTVGHDAGDQVLRVVAERLTGMVRASDTVSRLGGDEFVVVLPGIGAVENAVRVAEKILEAVSRVVRFGEEELFVTPSLGIAVWPEHGRTAEALIRHADHAMYHVKARGKAGHAVWDPRLDAEERRRATLLEALGGALDREELTVDGQPLRRAPGGEVQGVELLLRWTPEPGGPVSPAAFLPLLDEAGLERPLLGWMLDQATRVLGPHRPVHLDARPGWLSDPAMVDRMEASLERTGRTPSSLILEIPEAALITLDAAARERLAALRDLGVGVLVDHYGTSHLSLPQLRALPLTGVKLDGLLLHRVHEDEALVAGLATLCRSLGLSLLAQGVDTRTQSEALLAHGIVVQQGALHGVPGALTAAAGPMGLDPA